MDDTNYKKFIEQYKSPIQEDIETSSSSPIMQDITDANVQREKEDRFLKIIGQIESSGGKNFRHKEIDSGMHKGHSAAGTYGLMPNTIREIVNRSKDENLNNLLQKDPQSLKQSVESNPELEQKLARILADHVLNKQMGDEEKAAYSWFMGHNKSPERIEKENYKDHFYVDRYNKLKKLLKGS